MSIIFFKANSQSNKSFLLAEQYFNEGEYYTAAGLYEQFLNQMKKAGTKSYFPLHTSKKQTSTTESNYTDILYKQAESYRLANLFAKAETLYEQCLKKDSILFINSLFGIAVCQRNTGKYKLAENNITRFINAVSANNKYYSEALKEKQILHFIKTQLERPDTVLYNIGKLTTSAHQQNNFYAAISSENQILITGTIPQAVSPGDNPYINRLFNSQLINGNVEIQNPLLIHSLDSNLNQGTATLSANGQYLYFTQWKKENTKMVSSIYYSVRAENGWDQPRLLQTVSHGESNTKHPFCTKDGKYLFFASDSKEGYGNFDIWYAVLLPDGSITKPVNAGPLVNSVDNEVAPFYHSITETLVFASDRIPGMGGYDLYTTSGKEKQWTKPQNMGYPVNSSRDDSYFFTTGNDILDNSFFSSDRGSGCCMDTYVVSKKNKTKVLTGLVLDCYNKEPLAGAIVTLTESSGKIIKTTTNTDGKYNFELLDQRNNQLTVTKEAYEADLTKLDIERINNISWHTDTLINKDLCLNKKKPSIKVENVVTVFFDFNKSNLKENGFQKLDSIFNVLHQNSNATIQISGYTDGLGSDAYNKILSDKRAKACADYLIQKGINPNKILLESFGACCPLEMELINGRDNPDGRSVNRRALILINND